MDRASKQVFVEFMSKDQRDPEVILQDVVNDMTDNKKFRSYTHTEEWMPFFTAMSKIVKQICKKHSKLEKESESYKRKYDETFAEKEEAMALF